MNNFDLTRIFGQDNAQAIKEHLLNEAIVALTPEQALRIVMELNQTEEDSAAAFDTWHNVNSSFIDSVRYVPLLRALDVKLSANKDRVFYRYADVPQYEFSMLLDAPSVGTYYGSNIKGYYESTIEEVLQHA